MNRIVVRPLKYRACEAFPRDTFRAVEVDADDVHALPEAIDAMCAKKLGLVIIRGFMDSELAAQAVSQLDRDDLGLHFEPQTSDTFDRAERFMVGYSSTPNERSAEANQGIPFDRGAGMADQLARIFGPGVDVIERVQMLLAAMCGDRPVRPAVGADGRTFSPVTIRATPPTTGINLHVGNFFYSTPAYEQLSPTLDTSAQLSFFSPLACGDGGGELVVYSYLWQDERNFPIGEKDPDEWPEQAILQNCPRAYFRPRVGDLLVFDGGNFFHLVDEVQGEQTRWTLGGFCAFTPDRTELRFWS